MKKALFYSWQSDLPNNTNRGFIESCLKKIVKNLEKTTPLSLELNIDRDTKNLTGTPDIADSIFTKISRSKLFVADISIINSSSEGRKCPNPNVLIELGFAVRVLGWERIFCIYNLDYGSFEDLPFDLRQRRPISYSIKKFGKEKSKEQISKVLTHSITLLHKSGSLFDTIDDYIKEQVDTELLTIINHLGKILFGYTEKSIQEIAQTLLNLTDEEIVHRMNNRELIGFQIFKNYSIHENKFRQLADKAISSLHHNRELATLMIAFVNWIGRFEALKSPRNHNSLFIECEEQIGGFKVLPPFSFSKNENLPDRHILLKQIESDEGIVLDFGDFPSAWKIQKLLVKHQLNATQSTVFVSIVLDFIKAVNNWLDFTNGEFILDTYRHFEFRTKHSNYQPNQKY